MRNLLFLALFSTLAVLTSCQPSGPREILIKTNFGDITVQLYDETPLHRDNIIKLIDSAKYYDGTLFHRVIPNFMVQGGDPSSIGAPAGRSLGGGGPGYFINAEIGAPHLRGTLAAARTENPQKKSSGSQFYIVTGQKQSPSALDQYERSKGVTYNEEQRRRYIEEGGRPDLDMLYTVFGEVISGMEVVDQIAASATGAQNRPVQDVVMESVTIIK
ncbi:MAG: peptidyl-prolyl cis-trans isomerase B (cyclophilin B) [Neolewinella sp.]|jgi:peptidyl-prolyl cis-trans isomerase B (cyclophilin B)